MDWVKTLADLLLPYSYKEVRRDGDTAVFQAGNGAEVSVSKVSGSPTAVSLSTEEPSSLWAHRQVFEILMSVPGMSIVPDEEHGHKIVFKESIVECRNAIMDRLLQ